MELGKICSAISFLGPLFITVGIIISEMTHLQS